MTHEAQLHLTDEALDDVLIGLGSAESFAHLERCSECRGRVDAFQSSVNLFNQASLAWSEAQATRTPRSVRTRRPLFARPAVAIWATVAALLVLAGPPVWRLVSLHSEQAPTIATSAPDTETQITEDNELLRAVNTAIEPDERTIVDQYHLQEGEDSQATQR